MFGPAIKVHRCGIDCKGIACSAPTFLTPQQQTTHPILKTLQASPFPLTVRAICVQLNKEFNFTEISTLLNIWYKSGTVTIHGENTQGQILYGVKR